MTRSVGRFFELARKAVRKPPKVLAARAAAEARRAWEAYRVPRFGAPVNIADVLADTGTQSIDALCAHLARRPYATYLGPISSDALDALSPGETERLLARAERALTHEVDLLGSGPVPLGAQIDWYRDYKSGGAWAPGFFGRLRYGDPDSGRDVKFPWEVSRLQWLMTAAQAYRLTGDERFAEAIRDVLDQWIVANPFACSINWTCTMEVALRILTWTWFFHMCRDSQAWSNDGFRERFLESLYQHGQFTSQHLEFSDVNGNHYTADAAGLVVCGLFFGGRGRSADWARRGWSILESELPRQVFPDGVDYEASVPYHRLVLELFLLPALFRARAGLEVSAAYRDRLIAMAQFVRSYARPEGTIPYWGDADDARALPFGTQPLNDHRYLIGIIGAEWNVRELLDAFAGSRAEVVWTLGPRVAAALCSRQRSPAVESAAFPGGGCYVMRTERDHVFIDCGPIGLAGRGGHGHNDCLAFTAVLDDTELVSDCGAFVYTSSYMERNAFRSTAYHNTPQVDGQEMNRFISPLHLWNMHYDALPDARRWATTEDFDVFVGTHSGYRRLEDPVTPLRTIVLDRRQSRLLIHDRFEGSESHTVTIPLHLAPGIIVRRDEEGCQLVAGEKRFRMSWTGDWTFEIGQGRVSSRYGHAEPCIRLLWRREGSLDSPLTVALGPTSTDPDHLLADVRRLGLA